MPLTWNLDDIDNYKEVCWIPDGDRVRLNPVTEVLIFATMSVGISKITEDNAAEFYGRLKATEKVYGTFLVDGEGNGEALTEEQVRAHVGLSTNAVATDLTRAQFLANLKRVLKETVDGYAKAFERELV